MKPSIIIVAILSLLLGACLVEFYHTNNKKISVGNVNYSFSLSEKGESVLISRNNRKLCRIQEIDEDRIVVEITNDNNWMVHLRAKLLPNKGLMDLLFKTPKDEMKNSEARYQWIGSSYADSPDMIGVKKYPLE